MTGVRLALHQFRWDHLSFWRNPASVFFTVLLPVVFLVLLASIFGSDEVVLASGASVAVSTYYVPGIMTLAIVSATTVNLAVTLTYRREEGRLKRLRATPLPAWALLAGSVGTAFVLSALMMGVVTAVGALAYGVEVPWDRLPALLAVLAVASAAFSSLGFALAALIPSGNAASAVTNAVVLPLYFLSGVFIPEAEIPQAMLDIASVFPVRHLFESLLAVWDPGAAGAAIEAGSLAVLAAWGVAGALVAGRAFAWAPRG